MAVRSVATFAFRYWWTMVAARAEMELSSRLLTDMAFAPYRYHLGRNPQELLSRVVSHVNLLTSTGPTAIIMGAGDVVSVIALCAGLVVANPAASAVVMGYVAVVGAAYAWLSRNVTARAAREFGDAVPRVYQRGTQLLRGIRELTVGGARADALNSVIGIRAGMVRVQRRLALLNDVPRVILELALYLGILVGLLIVLSSDANSGGLLAVVALYVMAGLRILPAVSRVLAGLTQLRSSVEYAGLVDEEFQVITTAVSEHSQPAGKLPERGSLLLDSVGFDYGNGPVLRQVALDIPFGSQVAFIGPSGGGKSTLLSLVLGLLKPTTGCVRFGGVDVGVGAPEWFEKVAYLPQDCFIIDDTILHNVCLGDPAPDPDRAWLALRGAALDDVVRALPEGLMTSAGDAGTRLSMGQRQRLGLARALYRQPSVLVLDEPTAALDRVTEAEVMATIAGLKGDLTIVIVAHRLETLGGCDRIYQVEGGLVRPAEPPNGVPA